MEMKNKDIRKPYDMDEKDLILRDLLALDRTILANERTLLAWIRTALSIIVAGVGFIKFFDMKIIYSIGYALIPFGIGLLVIGVYRFFKLQSNLSRIK